MNWQLWHGPCGRKLNSAKSLLVLTVLTLLAMPAARAQQATRTQLDVSNDGGKLVMQANVADVESNPLNAGSVSFETGNGSLGSAIVQNGSATLTVSALPPGTQTVTAVYHPATASYVASASSPEEAEAAASTLPGFTVTANPSSATVTPGNFATIGLTITSLNGFTGVVNLSCSNLPFDEGTCNFTPVTATVPANGTVTSSLQITTSAPSGTESSKNVTPLPGKRHVLYAVLLPGGIALFGLFSLRRRHSHLLRMLGLVALLGACTVGMTACSARYDYLRHGPFPNPGTPAGTYSVVVAAYSSNGSTVTEATSTSSGCTGAVCIALTVQ
jgi:Bacterial Ig-like domain (group 3)